MIRVSEEQTWPDRKHSAPASVGAAVPRSMSSRMTAADFPPSSSVHRAIRSPQSEAIRRPAAVEPVKVILSTRGSRTSSSDTSRSAVRGPKMAMAFAGLFLVGDYVLLVV